MIEPFFAAVPEATLADLRRRLAETRWPDQLPGTTWEYGADLTTMRELADYWRDHFDWRTQEARLNRLHQFTTEIDGQRIHFIHQRSSRADAQPLVLLHGWPGSVFEFLELIGPLTEPHDQNVPAFHLVVPSLPGFGFSGPTRERGWDARRMARAFATLMERLQYVRYGLHGGDWGSRICQFMAIQNPSQVFGLHSTFLIPPPPTPQALAELSADEAHRFSDFQVEQSGYMTIQQTKPQTMAFGLTDSPVGLLAWIGEKFEAWTDHDRGFLSVVDRDTFLGNVTLYWVTGTVASSMRLYREGLLAANRGPAARFEAPVGHAVFPKEVMASPHRWTDQAYNITHRTEMPRGGHFAALEQPDLLATDIRSFFASITL